MEYIGLYGKSISPLEAANIKCSLIVLAKDQGKPVSLWGRVSGYSGEYYVAQSEPDSLLDASRRRSFFSVDGGVNWQPLPTPTEEQTEFCHQIRGCFMGDPAFQYKTQKELPAEEPEPPALPTVDDLDPPADDDVPDDKDPDADPDAGDAPPADGDAAAADEPKKPKRPKFRILAMPEVARLAQFVRDHDAACRIVPRGALLLKDGVVTKNRGFAGLDSADAVELSHYSKLQYNRGAADANREIFGAAFHALWDFLAPISLDMPQGVWSVKFDATLGVATVQNLLFAGSFFFHKVGTPAFGQMYIGDGQLNVDLCFMLP